jgi:hypothetical protein
LVEEPFNSLKCSGYCMFHLLQQSVTLCYVFRVVLTFTEIISLKGINRLIFVMVTCCVFFAVRTESLNIIQTSLGFNIII